jgi:hypothetical protein
MVDSGVYKLLDTYRSKLCYSPDRFFASCLFCKYIKEEVKRQIIQTKHYIFLLESE